MLRCVDRSDLAWGLCVFALWLNANPYIGIDHDARLYVLAAYRWWSPAAYARDPWFAFGSQDDYSLFSPLLACVLKVFGVANGALLATLLQGVLFSVACVAIARVALGRSAYPLAALVVASFPILYSPQALLFVSEGFATARGFAVPLSLIGLSLAINGRAYAAVAWLLVAFALHPIMSAAPLAVSLLVIAPSRYRPWLVVLGWVGYLGALDMTIHGSLPLMADPWKSLVAPSPLVFIRPWIPQVISVFGFWIAVLLVAWRHGKSTSMRVAYGAVVTVATSAVAFSLAATEIPWVTALQAQFWRALWLLKLLGLCAAMDLLWTFLLAPNVAHRKAMGVGAALIAVLGFYEPWMGAIALVMLIWLPCRQRVECWFQLHPRAYISVLTALLVLALPGLAFELTSRVRDVQVQGFWNELAFSLWRNAGLGTLALAIWWLGQHVSQRVLTGLALVGIVVAAAYWDTRPQGRRDQERRFTLDGRLSSFASWIPRGSTVSWHDNTERIWFELATAGYAGAIHATGLVFSEQRTILLLDRYSRLVLSVEQQPTRGQLSGQTLHFRAVEVGKRHPFFDSGNLRSYEGVGFPSVSGIAWLCQDTSLDFVIDRESRPDAIGQVKAEEKKFWYVYKCDVFRAKQL